MVNAAYSSKLVATLTADIDLGNAAWEPIGNGSHIYQGTLDGAWHTVSGINVNKSSNVNVGFFGATNLRRPWSQKA